MANSVDPDQTPRSAASDLSLHCLLMPLYPNRNVPRWLSDYDDLVSWYNVSWEKFTVVMFRKYNSLFIQTTRRIIMNILN